MRSVVLLAASLLPLLLAGCGARQQPFTYNDHKEMLGQAGLFTGRTGGIVLFQEKGLLLLNKD